ncbi:MAG: MFS transporter [Syntrophomonas sp.]
MRLDNKWQVLIIVCLGIFMSSLDGSILNIANPTIAKSMQVDMQDVQWVVTAYMLVITASLLFFGKLGDNLGGSKIYSYGFLVFTLGSFLCSLSSMLGLLIAARVIQALGASMMMATGMGIVSNNFPTSERGKALGITGSVVGIGNMAGPSLGGLLVGNFHWSAIFLINIPIGLIAFYLSQKYLPREPIKSFPRQRFDLGGTILFAVASVALVIALSTKQGADFRIFCLGLILMLMFYLFEKRQAEPVLDFELFKIKNFSHGNLLGLAAYIAQTSVLFLIPFYMERLLHFSPSWSGLLMTIPPCSQAIIAPLAGTLSDRVGSRILTTGSFAVMTAAYLLLSTLDQTTNMFKICGGLLLMGIGMGSFGSPNNSSILGSIPREKAGYAGGFSATVRNFAFSLGTAGSVSIFSFFFNNNLANTSYALAYAGATQSVYRIAAAITFAALLFSLVRKHSPQPVQNSSAGL